MPMHNKSAAITAAKFHAWKLGGDARLLNDFPS